MRQPPVGCMFFPRTALLHEARDQRAILPSARTPASSQKSMKRALASSAAIDPLIADSREFEATK